MSFEETGRKNDGLKPDLGLIHPMLLIQTAHVLAEGDAKYGKGNWKGLRISRIISAIDRHLLAIKSGEDVDPESRKPHVAHIASGCSFLSWMMANGKTGTEQDDRPWLIGSPKTYGVDLAKEPDVSAVSFYQNKMSRDEAAEIANRHGWACVGATAADWVIDAVFEAGNKPPSMVKTESVAGDGFKLTAQQIDTPHFAEDTFGEMVPVDASVARLQSEVVEWADRAIGSERTYNQAIAKLAMEELPELLLDPKSPLEWADCMIILLDLAHLAGINPVTAVRDKLKINEGREWEQNENTGLFHHVVKEPEPEPEFLVGNTVALKTDQFERTWTVESVDHTAREAVIFYYADGTRIKAVTDFDDIRKV